MWTSVMTADLLWSQWIETSSSTNCRLTADWLAAVPSLSRGTKVVRGHRFHPQTFQRQLDCKSTAQSYSNWSCCSLLTVVTNQQGAQFNSTLSVDAFCQDWTKPSFSSVAPFTNILTCWQQARVMCLGFTAMQHSTARVAQHHVSWTLLKNHCTS